MPKITRTTGSGMTERAVLKFDPTDTDDIQRMIRAAIETFERSSFDRVSRKLEMLAKQILESAGLPSDPAVSYLVTPDGAWAVVDDQMYLDAELHNADLPLDLAVPFCGYPSDSAEGYAARVLMLLQKARRQQKAGSIDEAMALAFEVGALANEAGMKDLFEADFLVGAKQRAIGHKALEKQHGTPEERAARRGAYLQEYDRLRANGVRKTLACELTAEKFRVSAKTIQRAVKLRSSE
ncbi:MULTISPECIES: hypothetical protein [Limimaricola]|uniref:hypothetical protein n=1 Tax=Limimaricola TaxID=2211638 RepID=UPI0022AEC91D|nr:hypothetical protein [Limimaricola sp. G21655-S1]MCZ4263020.1 hypothetical protein [Limimaricola sp. G21655-S1]